MKKINIVKENKDFILAINNGKKVNSDLFYIHYIDNGLAKNRYGISVSKKIGNAVMRNKYKRRIKDIIDDIDINFNGKDIILIARPKIKTSDYTVIKDNLIKIMSKIGGNNEK